jgi:hypothetical protein
MPSIPATLLVSGRASETVASERKHSAHEGAPCDRADDAVDRNSDRLLEPAHGCVRLRAEDAVDLDAAAWVAGQVAELELLLDGAYGIAGSAAPDGDNERLPRLWPDESIDGESLVGLKGAHRRLRAPAEDPVDDHVLPMGAQQLLDRLHGMVPSAVPDERPRQDERTHTIRVPTNAWVKHRRSVERVESSNGGPRPGHAGERRFEIPKQVKAPQGAALATAVRDVLRILPRPKDP